MLYQDTTLINLHEYKRERWHRTQSDRKEQDELVKVKDKQCISFERKTYCRSGCRTMTS